MKTTSEESKLGPVSPVDLNAFRTIFRHHPGGAALITSQLNGQHVALTVSSLISVSAVPPMIMFSVSGQSSSAQVLAEAETIVVHMLDVDRVELAKLGATSGIDRFGDAKRWTELTTGERVFHEAPVWFRARIVQRIDVFGSSVCVAEILESSVTGDDETDPAPG